MNRLRELREERELRQTDVAQVTGIDQKTLSNYETGKTRPDSDALIRLADFFEVSIDYLVGRSGPEEERSEEIEKRINHVQKQLNEIRALLRK